MAIKIKITPAEVTAIAETVTFKASRALNGDVMILDHDIIDIVVSPENKKVTLFPKDMVSEEVYLTQDEFFKRMSKKGIVDTSTIQNGFVFSSMEGKIFDSTLEGVSALQATLFEIYNYIQDEIPNIKARKHFKKDLQSFFLNPTEEETTELGEVPHEEEQGGLDPQARPYGFQYMYSMIRESKKESE